MSRALFIVFALLVAGPAVADDELDLLGGSAQKDKPATLSEPPPPASLRSLNAEDADLTGLVTVALERLSALELIVAASAAGPDRDAALVEVAGIRLALIGALVQVGRLEEQADLKVWLAEQGLVESTAPVTAVEPPTGEPSALDDDGFAALTTEIEGVAFTTGKMQALQGALSHRTVTTDQARALVELFSFSRDRVDALVYLHPRVVDPENFDGLLSALKFESDRQLVRTQLGLDG